MQNTGPGRKAIRCGGVLQPLDVVVRFVMLRLLLILPPAVLRHPLLEGVLHQKFPQAMVLMPRYHRLTQHLLFPKAQDKLLPCPHIQCLAPRNPPVAKSFDITNGLSLLH